MTAVQGATTAITRKVPPEPLRWLMTNKLVQGRALDYGCGRRTWYGMDGYDPHWRPVHPKGKFYTVTCIYVLNVVNPATQSMILKDIRRLLMPGGTAYIAVRRDIPKVGAPGRGTFQRYVTLRLPSVRKTAGYEIYKLK